MADTWEVRKDGQAYAGGPMETMPSAEQRRSMRAAGYQIYVDGRIQRDPAGKKGASRSRTKKKS